MIMEHKKMIDAREIETAEMPNIDFTELPNVTNPSVFEKVRLCTTRGCLVLHKPTCQDTLVYMQTRAQRASLTES
mgnify:CR=1 FL=1